jgi:hypothetical protein
VKATPPPLASQHWSSVYSEIAERSSPFLLQPPHPIPENGEVHRFWLTHTTRFPIEDLQKRNWSVFHGLLNSLVEIEGDLPRGSNGRRDFLKGHGLLPEIACDPYLALPFEERLAIELESLELEGMDEDPVQTLDPIEQEVRAMLDKMVGEAVPELRRLEESIRNGLPGFWKDEAARKQVRDRIDAMAQGKSSCR